MVKDKLAENATEHLEPEETLGELVTVRRGVIKQQNHALVATDRNLYAFRLAWPGQTRIAEVLMKIPIDDAEFDVSDRKVRVRQRSTGDEHEWRLMTQAIGKSADAGAFSDYIAARPATGSETTA